MSCQHLPTFCGLGRFWGYASAVLPWCLFKVKLCSPLQLGLTSLVGASLDYPQLLRLALPNPFMHESFRWVFCTYFYCLHILILFMCRIHPRNICLKKTSWSIAWRRRLGFGDFVRWTRRHVALSSEQSPQTPANASKQNSQEDSSGVYFRGEFWT